MYATRCKLRLQPMQPGDDVHEAGLEWSLASVVWHQFPDVNPSFVDAQYGGYGQPQMHAGSV